MEWIPVADEKKARYAGGAERAAVRQGNVAYAAGLALLMAGDDEAAEWLRRAAADWRRSWDEGAPPDAWGRPIGALKASLLAGDAPAVEELAGWAIGLGTVEADSPIGRYAGCLALLALGRWADARHVSETLRERADFPHAVGDALACIAAHDILGAIEAVEAVVASFEERDEYLEDMAVADTAVVLYLLARRRGLELELPESDLLPAA